MIFKSLTGFLTRSDLPHFTLHDKLFAEKLLPEDPAFSNSDIGHFDFFLGCMSQVLKAGSSGKIKYRGIHHTQSKPFILNNRFSCSISYYTAV